MRQITDKELFSYIEKKKYYEVLSCKQLSESQIEKLLETKNDKYVWNYIVQHQVLSENFIEKYLDKINWFYLLQLQVLSENFIEKHLNSFDNIDWLFVSSSQKLSESFIEKYSDKINWLNVSTYQSLSESFIDKFKYKLDLNNISIYQKLSESFIENNLDILPLSLVLKYQKLSESFFEKIMPNLTDLDKDNMMFYQNYSNKFAKKHNLLKSFVAKIKSYYRAKRRIKESEKYECYDNYFIAYKAIRIDRYSFYNFQYQYLPNQTYESTCDCTEEENSFGLNVGTYDFAESYLGRKQGIIVKCKVNYDDIGRIVHNGEKVRCFKITVLD